MIGPGAHNRHRSQLWDQPGTPYSGLYVICTVLLSPAGIVIE